MRGLTPESMQHSVHLSLAMSGATALALFNGVLLPAAAQEAGNSEDIGVMEINLKDPITFD